MSKPDQTKRLDRWDQKKRICFHFLLLPEPLSGEQEEENVEENVVSDPQQEEENPPGGPQRPPGGEPTRGGGAGGGLLGGVPLSTLSSNMYTQGPTGGHWRHFNHTTHTHAHMTTHRLPIFF